MNKHDNSECDALGKWDGFPYCETKKLHEYYHVRTENYEFDLSPFFLFDHTTVISTLSSVLNSCLTAFTLSAYNIRVISEILFFSFFFSQGR